MPDNCLKKYIQNMLKKVCDRQSKKLVPIPDTLGMYFAFISEKRRVVHGQIFLLSRISRISVPFFFHSRADITQPA